MQELREVIDQKEELIQKLIRYAQEQKHSYEAQIKDL